LTVSEFIYDAFQREILEMNVPQALAQRLLCSDRFGEAGPLIERLRELAAAATIKGLAFSVHSEATRGGFAGDFEPAAREMQVLPPRKREVALYPQVAFNLPPQDASDPISHPPARDSCNPDPFSQPVPPALTHSDKVYSFTAFCSTVGATRFCLFLGRSTKTTLSGQGSARLLTIVPCAGSNERP
jgi:hypothetical protein